MIPRPDEAAARDEMMSDDPECPPSRGRVTRREFIKIGSATTLAGSFSAGAAPSAPARSYPVIDVADVRQLKVDTPVAFTYPDSDSPALLVRLRIAAEGGVGPGNSIVAFSQLCTHKGCPVAYKPERKLLICPCHWSSFDPAKAGRMVIGQGSEALPRITLRLNGDTLQAVGIDGLVYGRHTNLL